MNDSVLTSVLLPTAAFAFYFGRRTTGQRAGSSR